jgi:hypothetical protein
MPFVNTVTSAWPTEKPLELVVISVIGMEAKAVSDQPVVASVSRKSVCSFAGLRSWAQRIIGRRVLDAVAAGSFGDAFEA